MRSDEQIQSDVMTELRADPSVEATQIGLSVDDGVVRLAGSAPSYAQKWAAERAAKRIFGVRGVVDELEVRLGPNSARDDAQIARAVLNAIELNANIPENCIKVTVDKGWVTLDGAVPWQYQKEEAESSIRSMTGITGITNRIQVAPKVPPRDVKAEITAALERIAELDARRIGVKSHDGKIILHGNVRSWLERAEAGRAAWSMPGVREVENNLAVVP